MRTNGGHALQRPRTRTVARRFWRLAGRRKALLAEAMVLLVLSRAALLVVPFRRIARRLGTLVKPSAMPVGAGSPGAPSQARVASDVGWAVSRAAQYAPFTAMCL